LKNLEVTNGVLMFSGQGGNPIALKNRLAENYVKPTTRTRGFNGLRK
jgi:hypothetical protein